jgi:hypothetical protein
MKPCITRAEPIDAKTARRNLRLLDDARTELEARERTFLISRGWRHTSATPGFVWMWIRELHGVTLMLSQRGALDCEAAILAGDAPATIGD